MKDISKADRKTVLITGASSGIGLALAEQFAADDYNVLIAARSEDKLREVAKHLHRKFGIAAYIFAIDLSEKNAAATLYANVKRAGFTLDALVNSAGCGLHGEFSKISLNDELAMMQLNMSTVVTLSKLFLKDLKSTKGKLLNVASIAAFQPGPYMAVYFATKAFVLSFTEALAQEVGSDVQVTALCPGPTASGFQHSAAIQDLPRIKGKRLSNASDVAQSTYQAMSNGRRIYIPGIRNWLLAQSVRFAPRRAVTWWVSQLSKPPIQKIAAG